MGLPGRSFDDDCISQEESGRQKHGHLGICGNLMVEQKSLFANQCKGM